MRNRLGRGSFHRGRGSIRTGWKPSASSARKISSRMRAIAGLDRDVELGALGRHVEKQPPVIDLENVGAELARAAWRSGRARRAGPGWSGGTTRCGPRARARAP